MTHYDGPERRKHPRALQWFYRTAIVVLIVGTTGSLEAVRVTHRQGARSEKAICAIKDFADDLVAANPNNSQTLDKLAMRLGHLVKCGPTK